MQAASCPRPITSRRRCVVAQWLSPTLASKRTVIVPEISHTGPGGTPVAGGPMSATSSHTTMATRLVVRTRCTPSAWSARWYDRSTSGSTKRSVHGSRRSQPAPNATASV